MFLLTQWHRILLNSWTLQITGSSVPWIPGASLWSKILMMIFFLLCLDSTALCRQRDVLALLTPLCSLGPFVSPERPTAFQVGPCHPCVG